MALVVGTNSYDSRANADVYFDDSLRKDTWKSFSGGKRDQAMVEATRILERQTWIGVKEVTLQDLDFPRTGLKDNQSNDITGAESLTIISEAQYEYAYSLLNDNDIINKKDATGTNIKKVKAGSAEVTYFKSKKGTRFPVTIQELISPFLYNNITSSFVSGSGDCSSFSDTSKYNLSKGLY